MTTNSPLIKPPRIQPGDTVAIVSPSAPALAWWPHRLERGRRYLESLDLKVRVMPHATGMQGWVSAPPRERAADLHEAFADQSVTAVLCSLGGDHSNQLLPYLDFELIGSNPKLFQGFSDCTVLNWALMKHAGLVTMYGPPLTLDLAEYPSVLPYPDHYLRSAWFGDGPIRYGPSPTWTDEFLDFAKQEDLLRRRRLQPNPGWATLRGGVAEGPLLGGCLETICWHLKGSRSWLDLTGAVLLLETAGDPPEPAGVDALLTDLEQLGIFDTAAGLIFGRPVYYDEARTEQLWETVSSHTASAGIPVLANVDCSHTTPMLTVPLGVRVRLDGDARVFETLEPATSERQP